LWKRNNEIVCGSVESIAGDKSEMEEAIGMPDGTRRNGEH